MINCDCRFTLFAKNFNIKKGKFVLSFCLHRNGHVDVRRILENTSRHHSIRREQKYRRHTVGEKLV